METKKRVSKEFEPLGSITVVLKDGESRVTPDILVTLLQGIEKQHPWIATPLLERPNRINRIKIGKTLPDVNGHVLEIYMSGDLHSGQIVAFCNHINTLAVTLAKLNLAGVESVSGHVSFEIFTGRHYSEDKHPQEGGGPMD